MRAAAASVTVMAALVRWTRRRFFGAVGAASAAASPAPPIALSAVARAASAGAALSVESGAHGAAPAAVSHVRGGASAPARRSVTAELARARPRAVLAAPRLRAADKAKRRMGSACVGGGRECSLRNRRSEGLRRWRALSRVREEAADLCACLPRGAGPVSLLGSESRRRGRQGVLGVEPTGPRWCSRASAGRRWRSRWLAC